MKSFDLGQLIRGLFCLLLFVPLFLSAQQQSPKWKADSTVFDPIIKKANASLATPAVADSLGRLVFYRAKAAKNNTYTGRGAAMIFTANLTADINKALPWYDTLKVYLSRAHDDLWIGYANMNLGIVLSQKYKFERAIPYLIQASRDFEKAKDTAMIGSSYFSLANAFHDFGNYEKGKKYAQMAIDILQSTKKSTSALKWRAMCTLAINYDDNKEYDKALAVHFRNLKNADTHLFLASNYNNIGNTYQKKKDFNKADYYLKLSLQHTHKIPNDYQYATVYNNLSHVNMQLSRLKEAGQYRDLALYYSKKSGSPEKLIDTYENAFKLANKTGDYKSAIKYMQYRTELKDSVFNKEKAQIVYDSQIQYETEIKEKENQRLLYLSKLGAAARDKAEADKQFTIYVSLIVLTALCLIFGLLYRNTVIRNNFISEQKLNKALFEGEQKERIRIARDLHDSIGQMLSVIKINLSNTSKTEINGATLELVDSTITEVRNISHNLIPEELNFGLYNALEDMCEKINAGNITQVSVNIPDEVRVHKFEKTNELSIYRIIQEVLNNMVKHAQASQIDLDVTQQGDSFNLTIKDNGKGFDTVQINKSKGLGWKNIAARVNLLDGNMRVRSEQLTGTQIEISIPST